MSDRWQGSPDMRHRPIVLVMHGDDDQIVPYADSGPLSAKLLQNGTLKTYPGFPPTLIYWPSCSPDR